MFNTAPCGIGTIDDCPCCESDSGMWGRCPLNSASLSEAASIMDVYGKSGVASVYRAWDLREKRNQLAYHQRKVEELTKVLGNE